MASTFKRNLRLEMAGTRERYAMSKCSWPIHKVEDGHDLYIYTYDIHDPYQDANGATWDNTERKWVN